MTVFTSGVLPSSVSLGTAVGSTSGLTSTGTSGDTLSDTVSQMGGLGSDSSYGTSQSDLPVTKTGDYTQTGNLLPTLTTDFSPIRPSAANYMTTPDFQSAYLNVPTGSGSTSMFPTLPNGNIDFSKLTPDQFSYLYGAYKAVPNKAQSDLLDATMNANDREIYNTAPSSSQLTSSETAAQLDYLLGIPSSVVAQFSQSGVPNSINAPTVQDLMKAEITDKGLYGPYGHKIGPTEAAAEAQLTAAQAEQAQLENYFGSKDYIVPLSPFSGSLTTQTDAASMDPAIGVGAQNIEYENKYGGMNVQQGDLSSTPGYKTAGGSYADLLQTMHDTGASGGMASNVMSGGVNALSDIMPEAQQTTAIKKYESGDDTGALQQSLDTVSETFGLDPSSSQAQGLAKANLAYLVETEQAGKAIETGNDVHEANNIDYFADATKMFTSAVMNATPIGWAYDFMNAGMDASQGNYLGAIGSGLGGIASGAGDLSSAATAAPESVGGQIASTLGTTGQDSADLLSDISTGAKIAGAGASLGGGIASGNISQEVSGALALAQAGNDAMSSSAIPVTPDQSSALSAAGPSSIGTGMSFDQANAYIGEYNPDLPSPEADLLPQNQQDLLASTGASSIGGFTNPSLDRANTMLDSYQPPQANTVSNILGYLNELSPLLGLLPSGDGGSSPPSVNDNPNTTPWTSMTQDLTSPDSAQSTQAGDVGAQVVGRDAAGNPVAAPQVIYSTGDMLKMLGYEG